MSSEKDKPKNAAVEETSDVIPEKGNLAQQQVERGYYYDDAHGYQKYVPKSDDDATVSDSEE